MAHAEKYKSYENNIMLSSLYQHEASTLLLSLFELYINLGSILSPPKHAQIYVKISYLK